MKLGLFSSSVGVWHVLPCVCVCVSVYVCVPVLVGCVCKCQCESHPADVRGNFEADEVQTLAPTRTWKPRESAVICSQSPNEYSCHPGAQPQTPGPGPFGPRGRECVSAVCALAAECQALLIRSAAEQLLSGALCEPASLLIYLLVKEITIAIITGRCGSTVRSRVE